MRLFIAIPLPDDIAAELLRAQEQLPESRATRPANAFHLTLRFLGELDNPEEIKSRLAGLRFAPFSLTLASIGAFPNWSRINVIWVGCRESREINELQFAVANRLKGIGKPDDHPFHPHFTLARVAGPLSEGEIAQIKAIAVRPKTFTVDRCVLYESTLTPDGPVYREIAMFPPV